MLLLAVVAIDAVALAGLLLAVRPPRRERDPFRQAADELRVIYEGSES